MFLKWHPQGYAIFVIEEFFPILQSNMDLGLVASPKLDVTLSNDMHVYV